MIDTECFEELNVFGPNHTPSPDLLEDQPPPPPRPGLLDRILRRRRVSSSLFT